jgi:predicted AAA+ superfamily ATPase
MDGYYSCDQLAVRQALLSQDAETMRAFFDFSQKILVLDEAQLTPDIGRSLKIMADSFPESQIIATGSSSFELANKINEPLTGRKREYFLYPLSLAEKYRGQIPPSKLAQDLIYGNYPEVASAENTEDKRHILRELTSSYLYKDVLIYESIKSSELLDRMLRAMAFQIGGEISYNELAASIGADKKTIATYIGYLEKSFIVFRITPFTKNRRDEIKKLRKIYFYDNGLRNMLINNLNPIDYRDDIGGLWENMMIVERLKAQKNNDFFVNNFYWRLHNNQEIDWVEEYGGRLYPYEFKWRRDGGKPTFFQETYPEAAKTVIVNQNNYWKFLSGTGERE